MDTFDRLFIDGNFKLANDLIKSFRLGTMSVEEIIAVLTMIHVPKRLEGREMLSNRPAFLDAAKKEFQARFPYDPYKVQRLLEGLTD